MTLAIPNPCGTISNHKWKEDESSFHRHTKIAAMTVIMEEIRVKPYSFPVLLITLSQLGSKKRSDKIQRVFTHQPANTLPTEIAIFDTSTIMRRNPRTQSVRHIQNVVIDAVLYHVSESQPTTMEVNITHQNLLMNSTGLQRNTAYNL